MSQAYFTLKQKTALPILAVLAIAATLSFAADYPRAWNRDGAVPARDLSRAGLIGRRQTTDDAPLTAPSRA